MALKRKEANSTAIIKSAASLAEQKEAGSITSKSSSIDIVVQQMRATLASGSGVIVDQTAQSVPAEVHEVQQGSSMAQQVMVDPSTTPSRKFIKTGVAGLDILLVDGIPQGAAVIICGGTGSGKTILNLQIMANACEQGKKCLYLTLEESEPHLIEHMADFGWDSRKHIKDGTLMFLRLNPFDIMRNVDALLAKEKGELLIDVKPVIIPGDFVPAMIFVDSLTAISAAFIGRKDTYRIYIEKLFRYFEEIGATVFLITETEQIPTRFSPTGTEEFLADGVIILYSIQRQNMRERAVEVLKMRGVAHQRKVVAMRIVRGFGVEIFPDQEVFVKAI